MKAGLAAVLFTFLLCACGQRGPLVLPDSPEAQRQEQAQKKQEP